MNLVFETFIAACSVFPRFAGLETESHGREPGLMMRSGGDQVMKLLTLGCPGFF